MISVPVDAGASVAVEVGAGADVGASVVGAAAGAAAAGSAGWAREEQPNTASAHSASASDLTVIAKLRDEGSALLHYSSRIQSLFRRWTNAAGSGSCVPSARAACSKITSARSAKS